MGNRKITGIYKGRKTLLTNDANEIEYRKNTANNHYGTYYVVAKDYVGISEPKNGGYAYTYEVCKK